MLWDIDVRLEDAFIAYLKSKITGEVKVYAGLTDEKIQYPCAVVMSTGSEPVSEQAEWHDPRKYEIEIAILTEACAETTGSMRTSRERHAAAFSDVMNVLAVSDLLEQIVGMQIDKLALSMAQVASGKITRAHEAEHRKMVSVIPIDVIAEPTTT